MRRAKRQATGRTYWRSSLGKRTATQAGLMPPSRRRLMRIRSVSFGTKISRSLGTRMRMFPLTSTFELTAATAQISDSSAIFPKTQEFLFSIIFNSLDKDVWAYHGGKLALNNTTIADVSVPISSSPYCYGDSNSTKMFNLDTYDETNGASSEVTFNPQLLPFYKFSDFWCGGLKYQWVPPRITNCLASDGSGAAFNTFIQYKLDLMSFPTQTMQEYHVRGDVLNGAPGKPAVQYSQALLKPTFRRFVSETTPIKGFVKNPASCGRLSVPHFTGVSRKAENFAGTRLEQVLGTPGLNQQHGVANFLFRVDTEATPLKHLGCLNFGKLIVTKYYFFDTASASITNPNITTDALPQAQINGIQEINF